MTRNLFSLLLVCSLILISSATSYAIDWIYSFDNGLKQAKEQDKPIMIDFYTDWCGWCKKLDRETYRDKEVIKLSKDFVCLKIDGDKNRSLTKKYKVVGYPTILFTDSQGKVLAGRAGFRDANALLSEMKSVLSEFSK